MLPLTQAKGDQVTPVKGGHIQWFFYISVYINDIQVTNNRVRIFEFRNILDN